MPARTSRPGGPVFRPPRKRASSARGESERSNKRGRKPDDTGAGGGGKGSGGKANKRQTVSKRRTTTAQRGRPSRKAPQRSLLRLILRTTAIGLVVVTLVGLASAWWLARDFIDLRAERGTREPSITLLDNRNLPFAHYGEQHGRYVTLDEMAPYLPQAVIAVEDQRFYRHYGLDPIAIVRALWRNWQAGEIRQGGSTITQQLAKISFLTPERALKRKLQEAVYAVYLESRYSKEEILEIYLNRIYLGGGAYGVDGAARRYFGRSARAVTLGQAAMLAGLIKAPSYYAPTRDLARAQRRADLVLRLMHENGAITPAQAAAARAAPATLYQAQPIAEARYFADWLYGETRAYTDAATPEILVRTTLEAGLQNLAARTVDRLLAEEDGLQAALVAMDRDGHVLAMVGGEDYQTSQFNRAVQARRQPGSAFKLFVYLAALEAGYRPGDLVSGLPIELDGWSPDNPDGAYPARLSLEDALARSVNTAAVRITETIGRERVIDAARRLGITAELTDAPSLSLGVDGVSLLELTGAYAGVLNGGRHIVPSGALVIEDTTGETLFQRSDLRKRVVDPEVAATMIGMLRAVVERGTGRAARSNRPAAGKTGTSSHNRDAWFIGMTARLIVGVWVGHDDGQPMTDVTGSGLPARIWRQFTQAALADEPVLALTRPMPAPRKPAGTAPVPVERAARGEPGLGQQIERWFKNLFD